MKENKYKYITEAMKNEVDELLLGEHAEALVAAFKECGYAAVKGFKRGVVDGVRRGVIYGCAVVGAIEIIRSLRRNRKRDRQGYVQEQG